MALPLALTGCATARFSPEDAPFGANQVNPAGANGLVRFAAPRVSAADLASQICPAQKGTYSAWNKDGDPVADAIACFDEAQGTMANWPVLKARRNGVLGYLMLRSDQSCALWVTYLERAGAVNRGASNIASVVTGGVGALVSGDASRILSGASGIASGTGAAIDSAMLHGLTEGLVLPRVAEARATRRAAIYDKLDREVAVYPLAVAISDALDYHAACNVGTALRNETPGTAFGQQLDFLVANASRIVAAKAALAGGRDPTLADVQPGAVFMARSGDVLLVDAVPAAGAASTAVAYTIVGLKTAKTASDAKAFLDLVKGGLVLRTP